MNTDCQFCGRLNMYLNAKIRERERARCYTEPTDDKVDELVELEFVQIVSELAGYPKPRRRT